MEELFIAFEREVHFDDLPPPHVWNMLYFDSEYEI